MNNDIIINISKHPIINLFEPVQPKMPPDNQIKRLYYSVKQNLNFIAITMNNDIIIIITYK